MENQAREKQSAEIERLQKLLEKRDRKIKKLRVNNIFLESLFDGISEEIMVIDNDFNITNVNKIFLDRYGLKKSTVLGKKCYEIKERIFTPCNMEDALCPVKQVRDTMEMAEKSYSYMDENGAVKEFVLIMYPVAPDGKKIKYFLEIARDVTENRQLMLKLQRSERRFRAILDTATDAIISVDNNHKIILFNNAAQEIFGYGSNEVLGKNIKCIISEEYGNHSSSLKEIMELRKSDVIGKTLSLNGIRKNGEDFPIELSLSFLDMGGEITCTAIIRDVTEHQRMENRLLQSERLAAVGKAVAHVAHEIKNPLMIIGGFSNQIKMNLENEKDINKIDMVLDEVTRLERMVANLGDFTKEYRLVKRPADINLVIKDVIQIMKGVCSIEKYSFIEELTDRDLVVYCDPDKLKQVFINVISNGIEAMDSGGTIRICSKKIDAGVEIKIIDEGIGISDNDLHHIFEPFYTTRERGSGLGLSISYKLIEAHNGEIWADSSPGKGTTFTIQLPA